MKASLTFEIYRTRNRQWAWRARRRNGRIIADGAETYTRRASLLRVLEGLITTLHMEDYAVKTV